MKIFIYMVLAILAGACFLPKKWGAPIRNLPVFLAVLSLISLLLLIRLIKYLLLLRRAKQIMREKGFGCVKVVFNPFSCMLHGQYGMTFQRKHERLNVLLLVRKKRYPHYYFEDDNHVVFYSSHRMIFPSIKSKGVAMANASEKQLMGKRRIKWSHPHQSPDCKRILLFDRLPNKVTDSIKRQELGNGDTVCNSDVRLYDLKGLQNKGLF